MLTGIAGCNTTVDYRWSERAGRERWELIDSAQAVRSDEAAKARLEHAQPAMDTVALRARLVAVKEGAWQSPSFINETSSATFALEPGERVPTHSGAERIVLWYWDPDRQHTPASGVYTFRFLRDGRLFDIDGLGLSH